MHKASPLQLAAQAPTARKGSQGNEENKSVPESGAAGRLNAESRLWRSRSAKHANGREHSKKKKVLAEVGVPRSSLRAHGAFARRFEGCPPTARLKIVQGGHRPLRLREIVPPLAENAEPRPHDIVRWHPERLPARPAETRRPHGTAAATPIR